MGRSPGLFVHYYACPPKHHGDWSLKYALCAVSCFMYRCEEAKACDKWSTYVKIELNESLVHQRKRFAIKDYGGFKTKAAEKGIGKLDFLLGVKHKKPDPPEFPNGRLYTATTEDEWAIYKEFLFGIEGKEYELVGRSIFDLSIL